MNTTNDTEEQKKKAKHFQQIYRGVVKFAFMKSCAILSYKQSPLFLRIYVRLRFHP